MNRAAMAHVHPNDKRRPILTKLFLKKANILKGRVSGMVDDKRHERFIATVSTYNLGNRKYKVVDTFKISYDDCLSAFTKDGV